MDYPTNKSEWWEFVDKNWDDLKDLILSYHPSSYIQNEEMLISAPAAEEVCELIREQISKEDECPSKV